MHIVVHKDNQQVFTATDGRLNVADSAWRDFVCFASPIIGAAYTEVAGAARRISELGYVTTVTEPDATTVYTYDNATRDMVMTHTDTAQTTVSRFNWLRHQPTVTVTPHTSDTPSLA